MMLIGYMLWIFIFPVFSDRCCTGYGQKKPKSLGLRGDAPRHYRVVEGDVFMMPCTACVKSDQRLVWTRTEDGHERTALDCGMEFSVEKKHSGKYTCSGSDLFFHLQVVQRSEVSQGCFQPEKSSVELTVAIGGKVACPGLNCSNNTNVIWYKGNKPVSEQKRSLCQETGLLEICQVSERDTGVYFCDRQITQQGVTWTFRRAVNVTVVPDKASDPPRIMYPTDNTTEEVELGRSHTLMCKVHFTLEKNLEKKPRVQWSMNYGGNMENMTLLTMQQLKTRTFRQDEVIGRAIIKEVTTQHLNNTYTCIASNAKGDSRATIRLKEKIKVKWPCYVGYPTVSLLLIAALGVILHVKWLEIKLIYRSRFQHRNEDGDEKRFDVLLSFVWSGPSSGMERDLTLSFQREPGTGEEACSSSTDPVNTEEGKFTQKPLEMLLPLVLEDQWGYRVCLLERDVLPGGAYTNDVVLAIQRSKMLICLLSADYLSNSNAVFVLESGIQALLKNSTLKLLLIRTSSASASLLQPNPPLPTLVQRALKVLPSLDWTSGKAHRDYRHFWRSLRKTMPDQRMKIISVMQDQ